MAANARSLRIATIATFLPAFPLCIAHGVLSQNPVPAVGLAPLAVSAGVAIFLLSRSSSKQKQRSASDAEAVAAPREAEDAGDDAALAPAHEHAPSVHPILVFVVDAILAAALMVVLVFTWIRTRNSGDAELAMLASYATIPLLINFLIHLYLAVREFIAGLALHELTQWVAYQTVPADCPHCGNRIRPDALPSIPWYESVSAPQLSLPQFHFTLPAIPRPSLHAFKAPEWKIKAPEWKTPAWLKGRRQEGEYASLFVDDAEERHGAYRDDPEDSVDEPSSTAAPLPEPVVEEVVVGKKDTKRGKGSSSPALFGENEWP
ncbi:hypothetical protein B0T22DRAFT_482312 [Podospora appendiculata]|uniref:Uncharacterized protein n=1 Tax=Podospora appendiculata TaxID=314037 RepID=A0AAE1CAB1_9PEZI|nr:hypothetical protein B0T22DRAFT_482312 [Podospora appendiculata]